MSFKSNQMTLLEKQMLFAELVSRFITKLRLSGYQVTLGEAWRSPETASLMAKEGKGIARSLHTERLAIDLCLFKNGIYLTSTSDYEAAGKAWKELSGLQFTCVWGGDFSKPDGNHFSIEHEGVR